MLTPEEHEEHKTLAMSLIEQGRVRSWRDLGRAFGISAQAAQMRFGTQYGLTLPDRDRVERHFVSVSIDGDLEQRLEKARAERELRESGRSASRASVVRAILEEHLPA